MTIATPSPIAPTRTASKTMTRLPLAILLATLVAYGVRVHDAKHWIESDGRVVGRDFLAFFMAGEFARTGNVSALYDLEAQEAWQRDFMHDINPNWSGTCLYLNPPHYAWAMSKLSRYGYGAAFMGWLVVAMVCFLATIRIWRRWLGDTSDATHIWREVVLLVICLPAFFQAFAGGQNSFISLLVLSAYCGLLMARRDGWAGLALALLAFKFQLMLVPLALLVYQRRWRALIGTTIGLAATIGLIVSLYGTEIIARYLHFAGGLGELLQLNGFDVDKQHSWHGFFTLLGTGWMSPQAIRILTITASLVTLVIVSRIWRGPWTRQRQPLVLAATMIANLLISPHLFHYDMLLVALPAVLWLVAAQTTPNVVQMESIKPVLITGYLWLYLSPVMIAVIPLQLTPGLLLAWLIIALHASRNYAALHTLDVTGSRKGNDHVDATWRIEPA